MGGMTSLRLDLLFKVWKFFWTRCAQATSCFSKKTKTPLTSVFECIKTQKSGGNLNFWISENNHEIVCFLKLLCYFSQRVYPKHVFFFFWKTQKYIILVGKLTFLKSQKRFFKTCLKKDTKMWICSWKNSDLFPKRPVYKRL